MNMKYISSYLEATLVNVEGDVRTDATHLEFAPQATSNPVEVAPAKTIIKFPNTSTYIILLD